MCRSTFISITTTKQKTNPKAYRDTQPVIISKSFSRPKKNSRPLRVHNWPDYFNVFVRCFHYILTEKTKKNIGELSGEFSELISESVLQILRKDPRRISFLVQKLLGHQLTHSLRQFIWNEVLLRKEMQTNNFNVGHFVQE